MMTRKERKRVRKEVRRKRNLSQKEIEKLARILGRSNRRKKEYENETFETELGEFGCFPFGGYRNDIILCTDCLNSNGCLKVLDPPQHEIIKSEWRLVCV